MRLHRVVGAVGRAFIATGVLILLFVGYQLWGTGLQEARAQDRLRDDFEAVLEQAAASTTSATTSPTEAASPGTTPGTSVTVDTAPPPPPEGEAVALVKVPAIGLEKVVVEGVGVSDLKKGPGHYPETPLPGQPGNSALAGHRTTYGAPFGRLDELEAGDPILVTTREGEFRYEVTESVVVDPSAVHVLAPTDDSRLTLTTCHPRYSARQRLIVVATLTSPAGDADPEAVASAEAEAPAAPTTTTAPEATPSTVPSGVSTGATALETGGLSGEGASNWPVLLWGALAGLVWLATWALGRRWRRWAAYLAGTPVFLVVLFVFYENVARLLPANV